MSWERSDRQDGYTTLGGTSVREERLAYHREVEVRRKKEKRELS